MCLSYIRASHERYIFDSICVNAWYTAFAVRIDTNIISQKPKAFISLSFWKYRCETCLTISSFILILRSVNFKVCNRPLIGVYNCKYYDFSLINRWICGKIVSKIISKMEDIKMSYVPPYQITDKILSLVAEISEKISKINERTNLDSKPHLRKNNKIMSIL